jgi:hypothetical protein
MTRSIAALVLFFLGLDCPSHQSAAQQMMVPDSECIARLMEDKGKVEKANPGIIVEPNFHSCMRVATEQQRQLIELKRRVDGYVPIYDGGACFFATSLGVGKDVGIHVFAGPADTATFIDALRDIGYNRDDFTIHPIADGHCPALTVLSEAQRKPYQRTIRVLQLANRSYARGEKVELVVPVAFKTVLTQYLLLVSPTGMVTNISQVVLSSEKPQTVEIPAELINTAGNFLLVWLSSSKQLLPDDFKEGTASDVFPAVSKAAIDVVGGFQSAAESFSVR